MADIKNPDMKKHAILFAEWINKNGWVEYDTYDRWTCPSQGKEVISTDQLYERFINGNA